MVKVDGRQPCVEVTGFVVTLVDNVRRRGRFVPVHVTRVAVLLGQDDGFWRLAVCRRLLSEGTLIG